MIHTLLGIAAVLFVIWVLLVLVGHLSGFFINLLLVLIVVALIGWLVSYRSERRGR